MGRKGKKSKLQKTKDHYLHLYKSWGKVRCPALDAEVHFTELGWNHLSGVTKRRTGKEKERRLQLLPLAKQLLEKTTTIQGKRFQNYHDHYEFVALIGGAKIQVVVQEYKGGYYFYSVFRV